ncbi:hypothetical protein [Paracoccus sp. SY]|uniref:putative PDDEXK endonuclease n=1 Tax=Paracoccus sp. SY TaxID=1330255 RepID=UPI000CD04D68|nr:hypothetical protein [Paracoccus sp. SY]
MSARNREKGASFERYIANELFLRLGISFRRDLDQYRERERGDLITDDENWPFLVECKKVRQISLGAWRKQATAAARKANRRPAVIYQPPYKPTAVSVPLSAFCDAWPSNEWAEITLDGFCLLAREIMAEPGNWQPNDYRDLRDRLVGKDAE